MEELSGGGSRRPLGGCSRDHWEGKSGKRKREKKEEKKRGKMRKERYRRASKLREEIDFWVLVGRYFEG